MPSLSIAHPLPLKYKNTFYSDKNIYSGKSVNASPGSLAGPRWVMAAALWDRAAQCGALHSV